MFEPVVASRAVLAAERGGAAATAAMRAQDALCELSVLRDPRQIWLRQHWVPRGRDDGGGAGCCCGGLWRCCCCPSRAVLRYRLAPGGFAGASSASGGSGASQGGSAVCPPSMQEFGVSQEEWRAFVGDLDATMRPREGCCSKGWLIASFVLLFYTTFVGIFLHMCAESAVAGCRARRSRRLLDEALERWSARWRERGVLLSLRRRPELSEADDCVLELEDGGGDPCSGAAEALDAPYICLTLPRPPQAFFLAQQQQQQVVLHMQQQQPHQSLSLQSAAAGIASWPTPSGADKASYTPPVQMLGAPAQAPQLYYQQQYYQAQQQQPQPVEVLPSAPALADDDPTA